jgi:serine/threonine-protein kinase HipA
VPLTPDLNAALLHGTSIGGARPKALIDAGDERYVAKFSSQGDIYSVVKAEFIAMKLAAAAGIDVAPVLLKRAGGKDVLLIRRFDREPSQQGWHRRAMVSAPTMLGLDEMMARYASYEELATIVRHRLQGEQANLRAVAVRDHDRVPFADQIRQYSRGTHDVGALGLGRHRFSTTQQRVSAERNDDAHLSCRSWRRAGP